MNILWTAPSAGTIHISGGVWVNNGDPFCDQKLWTLSQNGNSLSDGQFTCGEYMDISSPFDFSSGSGGSGVLQNIPVAAGDQIVLAIGDSLGEEYFGVNLTVTLTSGSVDPVAAIEALALDCHSNEPAKRHRQQPRQQTGCGDGRAD